MARIAGVDVPVNKRGEIALTYIYGIGRSTANTILEKAGIDRDVKVKEWSDDQIQAVREIIGSSYKIEGEWRAYEEGMTVTVEPGLYIAPDDETVDEKWRGIGIRIEDDVVVTKDGPRVLTAAVVKTVEEIEALMAVH